MDEKFEALRKAMLSSSKKVKGFVEENTVVVAAVGALAIVGGIYLIQYTSKQARKNDDSGEALSEGRLSIEKQNSSLPSEDAAAPPTPKSKKDKQTHLLKMISEDIW